MVAAESVPSAVDKGCGLGPVLEGSVGSPKDILFTAEERFVAGGANRGLAWANWRVRAGVPESSGPGVLGERFDDYVRTLPVEDVVEYITIYHAGIGVELVREGFLQRTTRLSETDRKIRQHRRPKVRNSPVCTEFVPFLKQKLLAYVRTGAIECLGTVPEAMEKGVMPDYLGKLTME
jgi:hypothetical protein